MPCRPSPRPLRDSCLKAVALNLEVFCYGTRMQKGTKELSRLIESDEYKAYGSPFGQWPSSLLEDLSTSVYSHRAGLKHLLHQVIQPQLTSYTIHMHGSIHVAMKLVGQRCHELRKLELTYSINLPPVYYVDFFRQLPCLTKVNLFGSMVDDHGFGTIGQNCPNLLELNAAKTWITDAGMRSLSITECGQPLTQKLAYFNVSETRVSPNGLSLFFHYHQNVVRIEHSETFQIFEHAYYHSNDNACNLDSLSSTGVNLCPETFDRALGKCPQVDTIVITSFGLSDKCLLQMETLHRLQTLHLANNYGTDFTFDQGLLPVLRARSQSLTKMVLEKFAHIDVDLIGKYCPNLTHLALSGTGKYAEVKNVEWSLFSKLDNLELWSEDNAEICPNVLRQLMVSPNMERILFKLVNSLTDNLFFEILQKNPMLHLRNVVLDCCHGITAASIWRMLEIPNKLTILRCWGCRGVAETDRRSVQSAVKDNNLTLYWEWYPYVQQQEEDIQQDWREYE